MYKFHCDYIKNKCGNNSRPDSLVCEIKTEDVSEDFSNDKEIFDFNNYSTKSKYYDNSSKMVVGKMKDEPAGVPIEEFVRLKPKMYLYLVDHNSKQKKAKGINKNVFATIGHYEYKNVLLNKKCSRYSVNRIQSKDHRIGIYEINKISLSCFDDKIYIQKQNLLKCATLF